MTSSAPTTLLVLDAEAAPLEVMRNLLASLVASAAAGEEGLGLCLAVAHGACLRVFDDQRCADERQIQAWAAAIGRCVEHLADRTREAAPSVAGCAALLQLPPHQHVERITFVTRAGSLSCNATALRTPLEALEQRPSRCPLVMLILAEEACPPSESRAPPSTP